MDINKLAILANLANGDIVEIADQLGVDEANIYAVLLGGENAIDYDSQLELSEKLARFERTRLNDEGKEYLREQANLYDVIDKFIDNEKITNDLLYLTATNQLSPEDVTDNYGLFANLNGKYIEAIFEWVKSGNDASEIFANYQEGEDFWNIEDSAFWEWYRETFYGD